MFTIGDQVTHEFLGGHMIVTSTAKLDGVEYVWLKPYNARYSHTAPVRFEAEGIAAYTE